MGYLQQLAREWYEYQGYFVRQDVWVGLEADGSYECDLAVVAFHPTRRHLIHVEPSFDLLSWEDSEQHFQTKFDAARKYLHRIFGTEPHLHIEYVALIVSSKRPHAHTIGGGRILLLCDLFAEIVQHLGHLDMAAAMVPDQWGLIRTLQYVTEYREQLAPLPALSIRESPPPQYSRQGQTPSTECRPDSQFR